MRLDQSNRIETQSFRRWTPDDDPKKILIIRYHAIGDVAITFPSCVALRDRLPKAQIDYLTMDSSQELVQALTLFDSVFSMKRRVTRHERLIEALKWGFNIRGRDYEIIVDLQRNRMSRLIRRIAHPRAWGEFNRFASLPAGQRTLDTFHSIGFNDLTPIYQIPIREELYRRANELLFQNGWNGHDKIILLNPAGLWGTRNWRIENYVTFARRWLREEDVQFFLLGDERIFEKAKYLHEHLDGAVINLVQQTSLEEAFALLQRCDLVVSEDSGLMQMAWVSGVPTIALIGSTRHDWTMPMGIHTRCFHSGDLDCGDCTRPTCVHGDVRCLTRYTPEFIFEQAQKLLSMKRISEIVQ